MLKDRRVYESNILVVDDEAANVTLLEKVLEWSGYKNITGMTEPEMALKSCVEIEPDLILLDLHMPQMDGYEFLRAFRAQTPEAEFVPVLVCTADVNPEVRKMALSLGANDFVVKPFDATEIMLRVRNFLETRHLHRALQEHNARLEQRITKRTSDLEASRTEIWARLAKAAEFRDDDTGEHTRRVGDLSAELAAEIGAEEVSPMVIRSAAMLHDVGKIGIPDAILLKPGKLTEEEYEIMKRHTTIGAEILSGSESVTMQLAEVIALTHHEKWDGSGYPNGIQGNLIPLPGRIVAVADVFDALTHTRPYKQAWTEGAAQKEIERLSGSHFDPGVVKALGTVLARRQQSLAA